MTTWQDIISKPGWGDLDLETQYEVRRQWLTEDVAPALANDPDRDAVLQELWNEPLDTGQGYAAAMLNSAARGVTRVAADIPGGIGYLLDSQSLIQTGNDIEAGLNSIFPVNPALQDTFAVKAAGAVGQAVSMIGTGYGGGGIARALAGVKAVATGAKTAALGSGFFAGAREGGQTADQYGMTGLNRAGMILVGGAKEVITEKIPFGLGAETTFARRWLGDTVESGWATGASSIFSEGAEEWTAQVMGNAATQAFAPTGSQTPGLFEGAGEAAALGAVGGAAFAGFNALAPRSQQERLTPPARPDYPSANDLDPGTNRGDPTGGPRANPPDSAQATATTNAGVTIPNGRLTFNGVPFLHQNGQWLRPVTPQELAAGSADAFVPLNPADPVEGDLIVRLAVTAQARLRQQPPPVDTPTASAASTDNKPAVATPSPEPGDSTTGAKAGANAVPPVMTGSTQPPGPPEGKQTGPASSTAPAGGTAASGQNSRADSLPDPTGADIITAIQDNRLRLEQPTDQAEWDWYRELQKAAAQSKLNQRSAEAAARRGELDDAAALLHWIDANVLAGPGRGMAIDEAAAHLAEDERQTFPVDAGNLGNAILDAIDARRKARQQIDPTADLEREQMERERAAKRALTIASAKGSGPEWTALRLANELTDGDTVTIGGQTWTAADLDAEAGSLTLASADGSAAFVQEGDTLRIEAVNGQPVSNDTITAEDANMPFSLHNQTTDGPGMTPAAVEAALLKATGLPQLPARVRIIDDPAARNSQGQAWKAKFDNGTVTLNAAFLENEADAVWNLEHELAHEATRNPKVKKAYDRLKKAINLHPDIRAEMERLGYGGQPSALLEEAAVRLAQKLDTATGALREAWQAFKEAVFNFLRGHLGEAATRFTDRIASIFAARELMRTARESLQRATLPAPLAEWQPSQTGTTGHAQPLDAPVLTPDGYQPIGSLQIGDALASHDGQTSTVTGIYPQGRRPVFKLTLADGRTVRATEDHLWMMRIDGGNTARVLHTRALINLMQEGSSVHIPALTLPN